jgi:hypothetical protein
MKLAGVLLASARAGLHLQDSAGAMPAGRNGPWNHPMTAVRCTAHWAITFLAAFRLTGEQGFLDAAVRACDFLARPDHRPQGAAFRCRMPYGTKTESNGLIGQAWAAEALLAVGQGVGEGRYLRLAADVLSLHPYDRRRHGWHIVEVDGRHQGFDNTLNHQVWFCAVLLQAGQAVPEAWGAWASSVEDFVAHLPGLAHLGRGGIFDHRIWRVRMAGLRSSVARAIGVGQEPESPGFPIEVLSAGYHSFVLHGLAMMASNADRLDGKLRQGLLRTLSCGLQAGAVLLWEPAASMSPFAYSYNPTGFEMAFALVQAHRAGADLPPGPRAEAWIGKQVQRHFDDASGLMVKGASDPDTLAARIYEAASMAELEVVLPAEKPQGAGRARG